MNYDINPKQWRKIFAVPSVAAENYLKLASGSAVKVLLFIAYNNDKIYTPKDIAVAVGISDEAAEEGLIFWKNVGVLCDDCTAVEEVSAPAPVEKKPVENESILVPAVKATSGKELTPIEIADRINSCEEVKFLFSKAESFFGHILNHTEQRSLIWIHDYLGFSSDIILMIMELCRIKGRLTVSVMENTAKDWHDKGITSMRDAEEEIERNKELHSYAARVKSIFGIKQRNLSTKESKFISDWCTKGIDLDLIAYAYDKAVDNTGDRPFPYINKILLSWCESGYSTRAQVDSAETETKPAQSGKKAKKTYDFDTLKNLALNSGGKE